MIEPQLDPITRRWCDRQTPVHLRGTDPRIRPMLLVSSLPRCTNLFLYTDAMDFGFVMDENRAARCDVSGSALVYGTMGLYVSIERGLLHGPTHEDDATYVNHYHRGRRWCRRAGDVLEFFLPGTLRLHRFGGPAGEYPDGRRAWCVGGRLVRNHLADDTVRRSAAREVVGRAIRRGDLSADANLDVVSVYLSGGAPLERKSHQADWLRFEALRAYHDEMARRGR